MTSHRVPPSSARIFGALVAALVVGGIVVAGTLFDGFTGLTIRDPTLSSSEAPRPSGAMSTSARPTRSASPVVSGSRSPLAVVTGFTNPIEDVSIEQLEATVADGSLLIPCGLADLSIGVPAACHRLSTVLELLEPTSTELALLPPGAVSPSVKVLSVDGADLFGGPAERLARYSLTAAADVLPEASFEFDPDSVRTVISTGESCPDRQVAMAAITDGRGWPWVFGGGTAEYTRIYANPVASGEVGHGFDIVEAVRTGDDGAIGALLSSADVTVMGYECPVHADFQIAPVGTTQFGTDPAIPPLLRNTFGADVVTLAANHITDQGIAALEETIAHFEAAGIASTGAGMDLAEALGPAVVDAGGLVIGFVGLNSVPGATDAGVGQPGVASLTEANATVAVANARADGAEVVICLPEWGWPEYHAELSDDQRRLNSLLFASGCDHALGRGTHWVGELDFGSTDSGDPRFTVGSHGNFIFGQGWSQETSEGVIVELSFVGSRLAQARLHPYAVLDQAQPNLIDPRTDGRHVLERIFAVSDLPSADAWLPD
jgi:poly-gamma-glutamate capsule biosynthesis protein CapA/YwtB (metallophosphatase superfamily)